MRRYWLKIVVGALAVFLVGYTGVFLVRSGIGRGRSLIQSSNPVSIPLAFVPFNLDGLRTGTFQHITIRREAPKVIAGFDLRIKLSDSAKADALEGCRLTPAGRSDHFDLDRGFVCLAPETPDEGLVRFGEVVFTQRGGHRVRVPLFLDSATVADLRRGDRSITETQTKIVAEESQAAQAQAAKAPTVVPAKPKVTRP